MLNTLATYLLLRSATLVTGMLCARALRLARGTRGGGRDGRVEGAAWFRESGCRGCGRRALSSHGDLRGGGGSGLGWVQL